MPDAHWDRATLQARVADALQRKRHPAGSPNEEELAAYAAGLGMKEISNGTAVVLGVTPELRALALSRFARVIAMDSNPEAIQLYRDWIDPVDRRRESLIRADWSNLGGALTQPVDAVLGDGVFANLSDAAAQFQLLHTIADALTPAGRLVTRKVIIPDGFEAHRHRAEVLLTQFRAGELDEAEFGFGTRMVGYLKTCYDSRTSLLDNACIFELCAARHRAGELSDFEHEAIRRYYFSGFNCLVSQREWERMLIRAGFRFTIHRCRGKSWYAYYPVYTCWRSAR